jgi:hypothetical protein
MMRTPFSIVILVILLGTITILWGGCKPQEPANLTIVVEGRELSDAEIIIDEKSVGFLTQTVIMADGKIYINGVLAARGRRDENAEHNDSYSGCSSTFTLASGKHTITLRGKNAQPLTLVAHIMPGHNMLTYLPDKSSIKWNGKPFQVGPERKVTITS